MSIAKSNRRKGNGKRNSKGIKAVVIFVVVGLIALVVFAVFKLPIGRRLLAKFGIVPATDSDVTVNNQFAGTVPDDYLVDYPDIDEYFSDNSQIIEVVSVADSKNNLTECEVLGLLEERGFEGSEVMSEYSLEGEYGPAETVSESSNFEHPVYETYYLSSNNELWFISVIDGTVSATPLTYNMDAEVPVIVSETNEIVSYDSSTNRYYRTIPNEAVMIVCIVDTIDAETLDGLTQEDFSND